MADGKEKTKAETALFHLQFMCLMLNVGREKEANKSLETLEKTLKEMIAEGN